MSEKGAKFMYSKRKELLLRQLTNPGKTCHKTRAQHQ